MDKKLNSGIYCIINLTNGKIYIGQSKRIKERWRDHLTFLRNNKHGKSKFGKVDYIQKAWNKYGEENFEFKILKYCKEKDLDKWEEYYINIYNSTNPHCGYNIKLNINGVCHSEETRRKISESNKGKIFSKETREKISKSKKGKATWNKGILRTKKEKENIKKGILKAHQKKDYVNPWLGRKHSEETKKKQREIKKIKPIWSKGKKFTEGHKQKLKEKALNRWAVRKIIKNSLIVNLKLLHKAFLINIPPFYIL